VVHLVLVFPVRCANGAGQIDIVRIARFSNRRARDCASSHNGYLSVLAVTAGSVIWGNGLIYPRGIPHLKTSPPVGSDPAEDGAAATVSGEAR
jgi:hypothetical protein